MPFIKGQKPYTQGGRKGYSYERKQLEQMRKIVSKYLDVVERIMDDKPTSTDYGKLSTISIEARKIMDKLHANKEHMEVEGEVLPFTIIIKKKDGTDS